MPITPGPTATTSSPFSNVPGMGSQGPFQGLLGGLNNIPGYQGQGVPTGLGPNFASIQQLLSQPQQSMTNSLMPGLAQILGLQTSSLLPFFQNQTSQMTANSLSGDQGRGLAGSSISAADALGAQAAGNQNMNQFIGGQLGQLGQAYQGAIGTDVQGQNQQYQNLAQAFGQQMQSQQAQLMFEKQLDEMLTQARISGQYGLAGSGIQAVGSILGGMHK